MHGNYLANNKFCQFLVKANITKIACESLLVRHMSRPRSESGPILN